MTSKEAMAILQKQEFLDKLYGFAYKRSNSSSEAEDLCSEIIVSIVRSLRKTAEIKDFYGFVWTIARRVYADYCDKSSRVRVVSYTDGAYNVAANQLEEFLEDHNDSELIKSIMREISFLAKIYRDVMVMYYIDELSIKEISRRLKISETAVKQRLFSARNTIRKTVQGEATCMEKNLTLQPVDIQFVGTGNPVGNDPRSKAERILSKNIVYLCRKKALTAKQISEKLSTPMLFIEDEIDILVRGENGEYGLLRKLDNDKYIANVVVLDLGEFEEASSQYTEHLDEFCGLITTYLQNHKETLENFPCLSPKKDLPFIAWWLITPMAWQLVSETNRLLRNKYLSDIPILEREFTLAGIANNMNEVVNLYFYGCDRVIAENLCGYKTVFFQNVYGVRIDKHYGCGANLSTEPQFMMLLRSIKGLNIDSLNKNEKEIAAKAIESGLLTKDRQMLKPGVVVLRSQDYDNFNTLVSGFNQEVKPLSEQIAEKLAATVRKITPPHLLNEYPILSTLVSSPLLHHTIEKCIEAGILQEPKSRLCGEGSLLVVEE